MASLQVNQEIADALAALATQKGISINEYLQKIIQVRDRPEENGSMTDGEFEQALDELAAGSTDSPSLPPDFSRADIYDDHD